MLALNRQKVDSDSIVGTIATGSKLEMTNVVDAWCGHYDFGMLFGP